MSNTNNYQNLEQKLERLMQASQPRVPDQIKLDRLKESILKETAESKRQPFIWRLLVPTALTIALAVAVVTHMDLSSDNGQTSGKNPIADIQTDSGNPSELGLWLSAFDSLENDDQEDLLDDLESTVKQPVPSQEGDFFAGLVEIKEDEIFGDLSFY